MNLPLAMVGWVGVDRDEYLDDKARVQRWAV